MDYANSPQRKVDTVVHLMLVLVHAAAAVLAAVTGALALTRPRWAGAFSALVVVSLLGLAAAVVTAWPVLDVVTRTIDVALLALFVVVAIRVERARRVPPARRYDSVRFLAGTGFGLVALADGFVVVAVFDLGAPGWVLVPCGLAVAGAGHLLLARLLRRRRAQPEPDRTVADREADTGAARGRPAAGVGTAQGAIRPEPSR